MLPDRLKPYSQPRWTIADEPLSALFAPRNGETAPLYTVIRNPNEIKEIIRGPLPWSILAWFCPSPRYLIASIVPTAPTPISTPDLPATMERHRQLFALYDELENTEFLGELLPHHTRAAFVCDSKGRDPTRLSFGVDPDILAGPVAKGLCEPLTPRRYPVVFRYIPKLGVQAWIALPPYPPPAP